jgi:hypothetical protein
VCVGVLHGSGQAAPHQSQGQYTAGTKQARRYMSRKSEERSLDYDPRPSECDGKGKNARASARDDNVNVKRG